MIYASYMTASAELLRVEAQEILKPKRVVQIQVHYQRRGKSGMLKRRPSTTLRYLGITDKDAIRVIQKAFEKNKSAVPA